MVTQQLRVSKGWPIGTTRLTAMLLAVAVAAWIVTVLQARSMGMMPGTMGLSLLTFVVMWTSMMAAMMLPSVAPLATRYVNMIQSHRLLGLAAFASGYLFVWSILGVLAFSLAWLTGRIAVWDRTAALAVAVVTYAACGLYQFTPLKNKCLAQCRAPFSLLLEYASWRGPLRHIRVGVHHGFFCLGCCTLLMALLFVFGVMNIGAMLVLTLVIATEKIWVKGETFSRVIGLVCFALAVAVIWFPELAPGLLTGSGTSVMSR
jgi:predicted metal-binding membrane protein